MTGGIFTPFVAEFHLRVHGHTGFYSEPLRRRGEWVRLGHTEMKTKDLLNFVRSERSCWTSKVSVAAGGFGLANC